MRYGRRVSRGLWRAAFVVVALLLAACNLSTEGSAIAPDSVRADLDARRMATARAQEAALDLWDRVISGEPVSCRETISVPEPVTLSPRAQQAYPQAAPAADALNAAIRAVRDSAARWDAECALGREHVPLEVAREGRAAALAAADPLARAATLLAARDSILDSTSEEHASDKP